MLIQVSIRTTSGDVFEVSIEDDPKEFQSAVDKIEADGHEVMSVTWGGGVK